MCLLLSLSLVALLHIYTFPVKYWMSINKINPVLYILEQYV